MVGRASDSKSLYLKEQNVFTGGLTAKDKGLVQTVENDYFENSIDMETQYTARIYIKKHFTVHEQLAKFPLVKYFYLWYFRLWWNPFTSYVLLLFVL